jgi:hypothetical protein
MPEVVEETAFSSVLGKPRRGLSQHTFRGGNAFVLGLLNKYRGELGTAASAPELDAAVHETKAFLGSAAAALTIASARRSESALEIVLDVASLTGHKLPTAYPSRRVWIHLAVSDGAGAVLFESGAPRDDGSIVGNDNDEDALAFEPHHDEIRSPNDVQIYESVLADRNGRVTTGLLSAVRYVKDNRLLPRGFDKSHAAPETAVRGEAERDPDFAAGGDRVRYLVDLPAGAARELIVEATLLYQPIGYRWAKNLEGYAGPEPRRFVRYYAESARGSAIPLATATLRVPGR